MPVRAVLPDAPPADPDPFDGIVIRTCTTGAGGVDRFFVDDVVRIGADIFKNGFDGS